jgi:hypothetical protein
LSIVRQYLYSLLPENTIKSGRLIAGTLYVKYYTSVMSRIQLPNIRRKNLKTTLVASKKQRSLSVEQSLSYSGADEGLLYFETQEHKR